MSGARAMAEPRIELSLVIPAYDEAKRLPATLGAVAAWASARPYPCEVVVVDDGSRDDTWELARREMKGSALPFRLLRYTPNRGKGHALKVGIAATRGERVLFTDADLSTPIDQATALLAALDAGADLAIGSRRRHGSDIRVRQPWLRETMGWVFTLLVRRLVADVSDATCGFKAFRGDVARELFARLRVDDWSFDAELLLLARLRGLRIVEVPVAWEDRAGTKVRLLRDAARSLAGLARIRLHAALGSYRRARPPGVHVESWEPEAEAGPGTPARRP